MLLETHLLYGTGGREDVVGSSAYLIYQFRPIRNVHKAEGEYWCAE